MNVLSLFDGMSCGRIALERAGIKVDNYYSSEIDKYAIQVSEANYPDIVRLGDVTKVMIDKGRHIDLLIAGSPCQGFSFAGKGLNFEDPRSKLFFEFVRILKECRRYNPDVKFLLENVKMKKEYQNVISGLLGVEPIEINSALVSAQNRKRLYWTNIPNIKTNIQDRKIILSDVCEKEVELKYLMNENQLSKLVFSSTSQEKSIKILAHRQNFRRNLQVYDIAGKTEALDTSAGGGRIASICFGGRIVGRRKNKEGVRCDNDITCEIRQYIELNSEYNKSNCLTTVQKDNIIFCPGHGNIIRQLTPLEYERLQTVPDNYTQYVSNSQRYKMLGNGWNVDVIAHIFKGLR